MASGVNVKMGVSGVAQFKQNMNQAKQSVKTLDAQLALTEKQFKASGDAEEYMSKKTAELQAKMEAQKSVVENAEKALQHMADNGVERSSTAYQKLYQEMLKAKGELIDTENALNGVEQAGQSASDGVSEMNAQLGRIGSGIDWQNVTGALGKITGGLESAAKKAISLGQKIFEVMKGAGSYADDLKTRSSVFGLSTDELQRMEKTAALIDTPVEAILNAQKKLKKGLGSEDKGVMGAFAELMGEGYDPRSRGWENAFWDAGEALMKFTDEEEKEVYAQRMFGRSWNELIPLFEAGRKEYEETNASWKVLSDEQLDSLGKMDDEYQKLQENVETLKMSLLAEFAEPMASLMTKINEKVGEFSEWLESDEGKAVAESVVGQIREAIEWITDPGNIEGVINAMKAIAAGWAAIKLTGGALDMLQLIRGAKNLLNGGNTPTGAPTGGGNGATGTTGGGWLGSALAGIGGVAAIIAGFDWAKTRRTETPELVRGTDENFAASMETAGDALGEAFVDYLTKGKAAQDSPWDEGAWQAYAEAQEKFFGMEGAQDLNAAYSDWLQEHSMKLYDVPEALDRMVDEITGGNEKVKEGGDAITDAAKDMSKLPQETAAALRSAMNGVHVIIDGPGLAQVIGSLMADSLG